MKCSRQRKPDERSTKEQREESEQTSRKKSSQLVVFAAAGTASYGWRPLFEEWKHGLWGGSRDVRRKALMDMKGRNDALLADTAKARRTHAQ